MVQEVPLYKQSFGYSCGPASLMMVLGSLDGDITLDMDQEISIWEDANLGESRATSAHGLALAAMRKGFRARVFADTEGIGFTRRLKRHFPAIDVDRMDALFTETRERALALGLAEVRSEITLDTLRGELGKGIKPIVLISTRLMGELVAIPHWVVITAMDERNVTIQNPEHATVERYSLKRFNRHLGFRGSRRVVSIFHQDGTP
ncbi:MAG: peptidase C39 family protein [Thermoplasmatota archaeon]